MSAFRPQESESMDEEWPDSDEEGEEEGERRTRPGTVPAWPGMPQSGGHSVAMLNKARDGADQPNTTGKAFQEARVDVEESEARQMIEGLGVSAFELFDDQFPAYEAVFAQVFKLGDPLRTNISAKTAWILLPLLQYDDVFAYYGSLKRFLAQDWEREVPLDAWSELPALANTIGSYEELRRYGGVNAIIAQSMLEKQAREVAEAAEQAEMAAAFGGEETGQEEGAGEAKAAGDKENEGAPVNKVRIGGASAGGEGTVDAKLLDPYADQRTETQQATDQQLQDEYDARIPVINRPWHPLIDEAIKYIQEAQNVQVAQKLDPEQEKLYGTTKLTSLPYIDFDTFAHDSGYVGLYNQGATCYMNSLLQALFMTPEFRDALFAWQAHESAGSGEEEAGGSTEGAADTAGDEEAQLISLEAEEDGEGTIPGELAKLFGLMQLSEGKYFAVETTELTRSFGWTGADAFQQNDVSELMRVLFDALTDEMEGSAQASLVEDLYQGEMLDYVRCKECNTLSARHPVFQDLSLDIHGVGSLEEALDKYVKPEQLSGDNQYSCEACGTKTDAEKGLSFAKLPYVLTLVINRFDYDYEQDKRVKLGHRVTFPRTMPMAKYLPVEAQGEGAHRAVESAEACLEEARRLHTQLEQWEQDVEESKSQLKILEENTEMEFEEREAAMQMLQVAVDSLEEPMDKTREDLNDLLFRANWQGVEEEELWKEETSAETLPSVEVAAHTYELYAVLVHSGSGAGSGHYYAYIRSFVSGKWYNFNDSSVTEIDEKEVESTFGDDDSVSATAYMLLYRRVDRRTNLRTVRNSSVPDPIRKYVERARERRTTSWGDTNRNVSDGVYMSSGSMLSRNNPFRNQQQEVESILDDLNLGSNDNTVPLVPGNGGGMGGGGDMGGLSVTGTAIELPAWTGGGHGNGNAGEFEMQDWGGGMEDGFEADDEEDGLGFGFSGSAHRASKSSGSKGGQEEVTLQVYYNGEKRDLRTKTSESMAKTTERAYALFRDELHVEGAWMNCVLSAAALGVGSGKGAQDAKPHHTTIEAKMASMGDMFDEDFQAALDRINAQQAAEDQALAAWEEREAAREAAKANGSASEERVHVDLNAMMTVPEGGIKEERVRLRLYGTFKNVPKQPFDRTDKRTLAQLNIGENTALMLEVMMNGQEQWTAYEKREELFVFVQLFLPEQGRFGHRIGMSIPSKQSLGELKEDLAMLLNLDDKDQVYVLVRESQMDFQSGLSREAPKLLQGDALGSLRNFHSVCEGDSLYVDVFPEWEETMEMRMQEAEEFYKEKSAGFAQLAADLGSETTSQMYDLGDLSMLGGLGGFSGSSGPSGASSEGTSSSSSSGLLADDLEHLDELVGKGKKKGTNGNGGDSGASGTMQALEALDVEQRGNRPRESGVKIKSRKQREQERAAAAEAAEVAEAAEAAEAADGEGGEKVQEQNVGEVVEESVV